MVKIAVFDDEQTGVDCICRLLSEYANTEIIGRYTDPVAGLIECVQSKPDVVFLDIEMPKLNGIDVARQILASNPATKIVFATAYDEYAVKAFELSSVDYILKPMAKERFDKTMERIMSSRKVINNLDIDEIEKKVKVKVNKIVANDNERLIVINPSEIYYFTIEKDGVRIKLQKNEYFLTGTLNQWEERMSKFDFYRCHKSFMVNLHKISEIHTMFNSTSTIMLKDIKDEVPVSRRFSVELKKILEI